MTFLKTLATNKITINKADFSLNTPTACVLLSFYLYNTCSYFSYKMCLFRFVFSSCVCVHVFRGDSVSSSQDGLKSRELGSAALYDVLPSSCPDQPAVPSDAYAAADALQEEGEAPLKVKLVCSDIGSISSASVNGLIPPKSSHNQHCLRTSEFAVSCVYFCLAMF